MIKTGWNLENSYENLPHALFTKQSPTSVAAPELVILNSMLAEAIGLDVQELKSNEGINILAGNKLPEDSIPIAQAYAGHQFGYFTKLGDGRAVLLGEQITPKGEKYDIQLKGSGKTPYSRGGDGRAALGPMLREYIISEAMQGLGIPTTRSLAVVTTGETVFREKEEIGAVLTRVASSHIRVGTFQYAAHFCNIDTVKRLTDYTINRHYPKIKLDENKYLTFLKEVIRRQAELIAKWQLVGFIHGVMNTDNMAISGETIDYGPCAFMDVYNPTTVFSSIDLQGRYAYKNQPSMAAWNLARFAETILPLLHKDETQALDIAQEAISEFSDIYKIAWLNGMRAKLGIFGEEQEDEALIVEILNLMQKYKADYTNTFLALTFNKKKEIDLFSSAEIVQWEEKWQSRLSRQKETEEEIQQLMKNSNPAVIPRNFRVEEALYAAVKDKDYSVMNKLIQALSKPYAHAPEQEEYGKLPPASSCKYKTFCGT